ncbi:hypothetical protein [Terricaulis sp.]|uniref:hypothetical protein n=1 Tax=Terricaulis sp. TaxID=2768686 RepID=UPI003784778E
MTSAAQPAEPLTYYNRPGASLADQRADIEACMPSVIALTQPFPGGNTQMAGAMYGAAGLLIGGAMDAQAQRVATLRAMQTNYDSCMNVRGWRVMRLEGPLAQELDALAPAELELRLAVLAGAPAPEGQVFSAFSNTYADGASRGVGGQAPDSLSLRLMPESFMELPSRRARAPMGGMTSEQARAQGAERRALQERQRAQSAALVGRSRRPAEAVAQAELANLAADASAVIVRVTGGPTGSAVVFVRADAAPDDAAQDVVIAEIQQSRRNRPIQETLVFAVPPGRWRLTAMVAGGRLSSFCLGAPEFDVGPGEAVFAGSFAFSLAGERRPDMMIERTHADLASAPVLVERMRRAAYRNGATFECGGGASYVHAFEAPDAPFAEGYRWGSLARIDATTQAAATAPIGEAATVVETP